MEKAFLESYVKDNLDISVGELQEEITEWLRHLNNVFGIVVFGLALASLGTKIPWFFASLSLLITLLTSYQIKKFPPNLHRLRQLGKQDKKIKQFVDGFEKRDFSYRKVFTDGLPMLIGWVLIVLVIFAPLLKDYAGFQWLRYLTNA